MFKNNTLSPLLGQSTNYQKGLLPLFMKSVYAKDVRSQSAVRDKNFLIFQRSHQIEEIGIWI
jgi:hypothetical protein